MVLVLLPFCSTLLHTHAHTALVPVACQYKRTNCLVCLEHHPSHLQGIWALWFLPCCCRVSEVPPADGSKRPCMTHSSCKGIEQECIKVCIKLSTASGRSVHAPGHLRVIKNIRKLNGTGIFISAERAQNLEKGGNGLSCMSNNC